MIRMSIFVPLLVLLLHFHLISSSSICADYPTCECEDFTINEEISLSIKCSSISSIPTFRTDLLYRTIEFDSCSDDLYLGRKFFSNVRIHILRIRHCNLMDLNRQTFANIHQLEKFLLENSSLTFTGEMNFLDLFSTNSFRNLKSLTLKQIHYDHHPSPLNFESLLEHLPNLYRLELINIHLDSYRHTNLKSIGQSLTYLSLANTHQRTIYPLSSFQSLEKLLIRQLSELFIDASIFRSLESLTKLKYILFEHNHLKEFYPIRSSTIDDIDFSSNLIEEIPPNAFSHLPALRQLTLTNNPLKSIDRRAFCSLEHLQRLAIHVKHQSISPLDNCFLLDFPHLQIVQDPQTKLRCNCHLLSLIEGKRRSSDAPINRQFQLNHRCAWNITHSMHLLEYEQIHQCSTKDRCSSIQCPSISSEAQRFSLIFSSIFVHLFILLDSNHPSREH